MGHGQPERPPQAPSATKPLPYVPKHASPSSTIGNTKKSPSQPAAQASSRASKAAAQRANAQSPLGKALRTPSKLRPIFLAVSVATITATGAWYGAGLKIESEAKAEKERVASSGPDERLAALQQARTRLVSARDELSSKIGEVRTRRLAKEGTDAER